MTPDAILEATQHDLFWVPDSVERLDRDDVLALRDGTDAPLLNAVLKTRSSAVESLITEIEAWHTGVSRWLVVPGPSRTALLEALPRRGYREVFRGDAFTMPTNARIPTGDVEVVRVHDVPTLLDNRDAAQQAFGGVRAPLPVEQDLALCTAPGSRTVRFNAYVDGRIAGSGNLNTFADLRFGFLWAGCTVPALRGRGVYRALLQARLDWGRANGLDRVGLYAKHDTSGPVVRAVGFEKHGPMSYFQR